MEDKIRRLNHKINTAKKYIKTEDYATAIWWFSNAIQHLSELTPKNGKRNIN